jgi:hypothetical protein
MEGHIMTRRSICSTATVRFAAAILWLASLGIGAEVRASYITPNPGLPPQGGTEPPGYFGQDPVVYHLPGETIELFNVLHSTFTNIVVTTVGANEFETFNSILSGQVSINGGPLSAFQLTGSVEVEAFGKAGQTVGTFATQMLSLGMTGTIGGNSVSIMLDPAVPSLGATQIAEISTGPPPLFQITSFFDVFTELSVNNSPFVPSDGGHFVVLNPIPEPSSLIILGMAGLIVPAYYARWGRRRAC